MRDVTLSRQQAAAVVSARRAELGLTLDALARRAGVSARTIWSAEHGERRPHPATLRAILAALGMTVRDIARPPAPGKCAPGLGWPLLPGKAAAGG